MNQPLLSILLLPLFLFLVIYFYYLVTELVKAAETVPSRSVARKSTNRKATQDHLGPVSASEKPKEYIEQQHPGYFVVSVHNVLFSYSKLLLIVVIPWYAFEYGFTF